MKIRNKRELLKQLETIKDFRTDRHKIEYALSEVLFMSIFGLLKGYVTFKELHCWMGYNEHNTLFKKLFKKTEIKILFTTIFRNHSAPKTTTPRSNTERPIINPYIKGFAIIFQL